MEKYNVFRVELSFKKLQHIKTWLGCGKMSCKGIPVFIIMLLSVGYKNSFYVLPPSRLWVIIIKHVIILHCKKISLE